MMIVLLSCRFEVWDILLYCDLIRDMMYVYDLEITLGSLDEDRVDILLIEFV